MRAYAGRSQPWTPEDDRLVLEADPRRLGELDGRLSAPRTREAILMRRKKLLRRPAGAGKA